MVELDFIWFETEQDYDGLAMCTELYCNYYSGGKAKDYSEPDYDLENVKVLSSRIKRQQNQHESDLNWNDDFALVYGENHGPPVTRQETPNGHRHLYYYRGSQLHFRFISDHSNGYQGFGVEWEFVDDLDIDTTEPSFSQTTEPIDWTEKPTTPGITEFSTTPGFSPNSTEFSTTPGFQATTNSTLIHCVIKPKKKAKMSHPNHCKRNFDPKACKFLHKHNSLRKQHKDTKCLILCPDLNESAQNYAEKMIEDDLMCHSDGAAKQYGENLAIWKGPGDKREDEEFINSILETMVQKWYDEINNYDFKTGTHKVGKEKEEIYHFTLLVWKGAKRLGFGYKVFYNAEGGGKQHYGKRKHTYIVLVGHYDTGNIENQFVANVQELKNANERANFGNCTKFDKNKNCEYDCEDDYDDEEDFTTTPSYYDPTLPECNATEPYSYLNETVNYTFINETERNNYDSIQILDHRKGLFYTSRSGNYQSSTDRNWYLNIPTGKMVKMYFLRFETEQDYDGLAICTDLLQCDYFSGGIAKNYTELEYDMENIQVLSSRRKRDLNWNDDFALIYGKNHTAPATDFETPHIDLVHNRRTFYYYKGSQLHFRFISDHSNNYIGFAVKYEFIDDIDWKPECNDQFKATIIQPDNTIRLLDQSRPDHCAFKKYASYNSGDEIWYKKCDAENQNQNKAGKYLWNFDESTGQIQSKGAFDLQQKSFCWQISSLTRFGKQRVKIYPCDGNNEKQKFVVINGRLHAKGETRICLGVEEHKIDENNGIALTFQDCYPTTWGDGTCSKNLVKSDKIISPFDSENTCLFKKYSGYNPQDEIWLKSSCEDAKHHNINKAGKYWWSYNTTTGLIYSEGSRYKNSEQVYCMRINSITRFYKQRVKLALCDQKDILQQFDFENGKIYSRANPRLCAGYEFNKMEASGETAFIFSTCFPNAFAIDMNNFVKVKTCKDPQVHEIKSGNFLGEITVYKNMDVSFDITVGNASMINSYSNLFQVGNLDLLKYPGLFFKPNSLILCCMFQPIYGPGAPWYFADTQEELIVGQTYHIQMTSFNNGVSCKIDDFEFGRNDNFNMTVDNIWPSTHLQRVYAARPFQKYGENRGEISNLKIVQLDEGGEEMRLIWPEFC